MKGNLMPRANVPKLQSVVYSAIYSFLALNYHICRWVVKLTKQTKLIFRYLTRHLRRLYNPMSLYIYR